MKSNTNILLERLRRQPRHGMPDDPKDQAKYLSNEIKSLMDILPNLSSIYKSYTEVLQGVNTAEAQRSQGLRQVVEFQRNYQSSIKTLYESITFLEEENKSLAKSFGLNTKNGAKLANSIRSLAMNVDKTAVSFGVGEDKLFEYAKSLRTLTGNLLTSTNVASGYGKQMMMTQDIIQTNMGLTEEAANGFELYAAGMGKSGIDMLGVQQKIADSIEKATGLDALAVQRDLTEDIGQLTSDLQMRYNKIPGSLELAVLKSKALGLSMRDLNSAGDNLLSIESSIGQELEYQLLSGKRLLTQDKKSLTDAYRRATLEGNADKMASLMNEALTEQGDILKNNLFARKKFADLMGMDEAAVSKAIQKQEILTKLGKANLMNLSGDKFTAAMAQLEKDVATDKDRKELFEKLKEATTTKTTAEESLDRLKAIETNTKLTKGISPGEMQKLRTDLINQVTGDTSSFGKLVTQFNDDRFIQLVGKFANIDKVTTAVKEPFEKLVKNIPYVGSKLEEMIKKLGEVTTLLTQIKTTDVNDTLIMPDRGPILRPAKNDVIAAFRPGDVIDRTMKSAGNGTSIDYAKLAQAMAMAMSNVKVEATVKTDNLYAGTKLNGPRRFGQG